MAKNPSQVGASAIWDGPSKPTNLVPGNSFGPNGMKVSQAPVSARAQSQQGGNVGALRNYAKYDNPTAK